MNIASVDRCARISRLIVITEYWIFHSIGRLPDQFVAAPVTATTTVHHLLDIGFSSSFDARNLIRRLGKRKLGSGEESDRLHDLRLTDGGWNARIEIAIALPKGSDFL